MAMGASAITCCNLSKGFWRKKSLLSHSYFVPAIENLSLQIDTGEAVAFLGPNGAGKSTTIKLLCGILKPDSGTATLAMQPAGSFEANKNLGLVFGTRSNLWMYLTVQQNLELAGATYFLSRKQAMMRISYLAELFGIDDFLQAPPNTLSLGERMRCEIAASLIHKPAILLADEPTIGLDIVGKLRFRNLLKTWQADEKATLLLTSHDISDVAALCQRTILINKGKCCYDGPLSGLKGGDASKRIIKVTLAQPVYESPQLSSGIIMVYDDQLCMHFQVDLTQISIATAVSQLVQLLASNIIDIAVEEVSLEAIISQWYTRDTP